jgi:hypothetical protein
MLPEVANVPDQAPLAVHEVALVEDHVTVTLCPTVIVVGLADSVTVAAGAVLTVTAAEACPLPPAPVQVNV